MNRRAFPHRLLALALCTLTACATWKAQSVLPAETLSTSRKLVRLTLADGTQHTMSLARVEGDSIVGVHPRPTRTGRNAMSYPLSEVREVEVAEISSGRTAGLVGGVLAGAYIVLAITFRNFGN
jgi:hypothetical protein